jgi:DNA repair protein SbcD/Mre11
MRILHTSDWHLGQRFHDFERTLEHEAFLKWLIETLEEKAVDVLIVSGDVYDTANPSALSVKMLTRFIKEAHTVLPKLQMVITGGNHDSGSRLEGPKVLAEAFKAHIIGNLPIVPGADGFVVDWEQSIIPLKNSEDQVEALVGAIPFVRPADWSIFRQKAQEKYENQDYATCMQVLYEELYENMKLLQTKQEGECKLVAMGHLTMRGGSISGNSERRLVIGGEESLSTDIFDEGFDYVALGHLHKAQRVGREHIRYCGSPLPLSYSEKDYNHQVVMLDTENWDEIEIIKVPRKVDLISIPAKAMQKEDVLEAIANWQPEVELENPDEHPYLIVPVKLDKPDSSLMVDIQNALKDKPLRLCHIAPELPELNVNEVDLHLETSVGLQNLDPNRIFKHELQKKLIPELLENEKYKESLMTAFDEILEQSLSQQPGEN